MSAFIGTKPNEVPSNAMLGKLAYIDGDGGIVYGAITAATTINGNDKCRLFDVTSGTFTLSFISAANLPLDWKVYVRNSGTGTITLDPAGAETIDGVSTLSLFSGETRMIYGTGSALRSVLLVGEEVLTITEEYSSGTSGGSYSADTWSDRVVNTVKVNRINGASLASNTITLPAGTYSVSAVTTVVGGGSTLITIRVFNSTNTTTLLTGTPVSPLGTSAANATISINGVFSLTATSSVKLQMYPKGSSSGSGSPITIASTNEVYTNITIRKIA